LRKRPWVAVLFLIAALAIAGAPPFAVFGSEIVILRAAAAGGDYLVMGLLTLFIVVAFIGITLQGNRMVFGAASTEVSNAEPAPRSLLWVGVLALAPVLLFGIWLPPPMVHLLHAAAAELAGGLQ
ncbi:MAG: proton-conducting transporter membrane subunit, partial [Rhodanobacteraceae bacterium]